ncbi:MAG: HAMP domain-containing protein [Deltaproteobacteria bacterium]|nr:HAMP domain-containing protein [Deltaproteobacteria bacterium]
MTLRAKVLLAQIPLLAALAGLTVLALVTISRLGESSQTILKDNYRSVLAAERMRERAERIDSALLTWMAGIQPEGLELAGREGPRFEAELRFQEGNITEPGEIELTRRLRERWERVKVALREVSSSRDPPAIRREYSDRISPALEELRAAVDEILALNQEAMVRKSDRARGLAEKVRLAWAIAALAAGIVAILASTVLTRRVLRPVHVLQQAVRRFGEGDWDARARLAGGDEIVELAREFNGMAEHLQQYRKSSLGELLRAQLAAQASMDSLPEPVFILGLKGEVISINRAAEEVLGDISSLDQVNPELREALVRAYSHVLAGKGPLVPKGMQDALQIPTGSGNRQYLLWTAPFRDEDGITIGATEVLQDVTRFKRLEDLRDDMVSTVAHEFRTPLTAIRMSVHLCLEEAVGPLTEKQADLLSAAREECERLQTIVDDLLDLSRIRSGKIELRLRSVSASELTEDAVARHRDAASRASVALLCVETGRGESVLGDPERLALVFDNLIGNALRHTPPEGSVEVRARREGAAVRFEVADTGPGVPGSSRDKIFEKGYRVPGSAAGAAGFGLAIAKEIVAAHRGRIGVESAVPGGLQAKRGSVFWFTIPVSPQPR